jgi:cellobiose-specific phosphotransferase system component IIA
MEADVETAKTAFDALERSTRSAESMYMLQIKTGHKSDIDDFKSKYAAAERELNKAHEGIVKETESEYEAAAKKRAVDATAAAAERADLVAETRKEIDRLTDLLKKMKKVRMANAEFEEARMACTELLEDDRALE